VTDALMRQPARLGAGLADCSRSAATAEAAKPEQLPDFEWCRVQIFDLVKAWDDPDGGQRTVLLGYRHWSGGRRSKAQVAKRDLSSDLKASVPLLAGAAPWLSQVDRAGPGGGGGVRIV
jgi:hypothetical protein